jgi:dTDP-4-dehydrorhamnose reductase
VKILLMGASGMLGHRLLQRLSPLHETWGTVRSATDLPMIPGVEREQLLPGVAAEDSSALALAVERVAPDVIINCVGIVKQRAAAKDALQSIEINALLPHRLARLAEDSGARLVHFSTDCVFSGRQGPYSESDNPDPTDLYGRSKLLGEVDYPACLTIRTSIVGRSLREGTGLFDWLFAQRGGQVRGWRHALYTGLTTDAMADVVAMLLKLRPMLSGVWQVSAEPIDKCSLIQLVNEVHDLGITIEADDSVHCDRRLDSTRFRRATGWEPPSWRSMIETMHAGAS